jgi:hypothetical protein
MSPFKLHIDCALMKGVSRNDPKDGARAVPAGKARNFALGRLRASTRPALRLACEVLAALAPGRVLPFAPGNSRKRGPGLSRRVTALASAAVERREASALAHSALPRLRTVRLQDIAPSGAPPPFAFVEAKRSWLWHSSDASASRERCRSSAPAQAGEGDHPKLRSSAGWWRGRECQRCACFAE